MTYKTWGEVAEVWGWYRINGWFDEDERSLETGQFDIIEMARMDRECREKLEGVSFLMKMTNSEFYCTQCGNQGIPVWRKQNQQRESGHLKKLFCLHCQKETNHVEVRHGGSYQYSDFCKEFKYGNFTEDGQRKMTYRQFCASLRNRGVDDDDTKDKHKTSMVQVQSLSSEI